ncbi:hypothetical protein Tco_0791223 [Tanacetum coccineum]
MHNNIMAAGSRDRPPMLATGRYAQWRSHFLRYIDTRPNGDALRKCILKGPYTHSTVIILAEPATKNSSAVLITLKLIIPPPSSKSEFPPPYLTQKTRNLSQIYEDCSRAEEDALI